MINNNSQKGFAKPIIIAIIALVVVVVGVGYYATRKQPQTTPTTQAPAGEKKLEDGTIVKADGIMVKPDGTMIKPDGTMIKPDGTMIKPDGTMVKPDGTMIKPDGTIVKPTSGAVGDKTSGESMMKYTGAILAGKSAPLLDFVKADYDAALKSDKLVVLYFYANWCPICKNETANALYPAFNELTTDKVIGFRVNYNDNQTDNDEKNLAREFGVAYQHTKVFVRNSQRTLKSPEGWDKTRYLDEISKALGQ